MSCSNVGVSLDNADKLQYAAIEKFQIARMKRIRKSLRAIKIPTIKKDTLDSLSLSLGPELDVGRDDALPSCISNTFFAPCDWPLDVLEDRTWHERRYWYDLGQVRRDPAILLHYIQATMTWYEECLDRLSNFGPDLWHAYRDQLSIKEEIGLSLPYRLFQERGSIKYYHEYCGMWDDAILLSEAEAAAALVRYQLRSRTFTNHHTKPALIATLLRNQTARLTQAYFDGKQNKLVLRQSRTLDVSGPEPSPDAWTLVRWIASQPVGETRYSAEGVNPTNARGPPPANIAPGVLV